MLYPGMTQKRKWLLDWVLLEMGIVLIKSSVVAMDFYGVMNNKNVWFGFINVMVRKKSALKKLTQLYQEIF